MKIGYDRCGPESASKGSAVIGPEPQNLAVKGRFKLLTEPEAEGPRTVIRRRRTRRHRRNRRIRLFLLLVCGALTLGFAAVALQYLSPSLFRASRHAEPDRKSAEASRNLLLLTQQESLRQMENRPVYPYSVVAGGVHNVRELKWAAEHDPVVRAHYAGFDYDHARVVRLVLARTAYISYRIGNKVYWTRHRVSLKKGETVITDGKITARTRCANRVEEVPQQATLQSEPPAAKFDEPIHPATGIAMAEPPVPFQSSLSSRPSVASLGPAPPLGVYDPIGGGNWAPLSPPPVPSVCGIITKKPGSGTGTAVTVVSASGNKKKKGDPCASGGGGGGGIVPEPGTWLLVGSGFLAMYWMARQKLART